RSRHTRFPRDWSSDVCSPDLEYFRRAVQARPGHGEAHFHMGYSLEKLGRKHEAATSFRLAVASRIDRKLRIKGFWKVILYYKYRSEERRVGKACQSRWSREVE